MPRRYREHDVASVTEAVLHDLRLHTKLNNSLYQQLCEPEPNDPDALAEEMAPRRSTARMPWSPLPAPPARLEELAVVSALQQQWEAHLLRAMRQYCDATALPVMRLRAELDAPNVEQALAAEQQLADDSDTPAADPMEEHGADPVEEVKAQLQEESSEEEDGGGT